MNKNCDYCGLTIYSETYHKCVESSVKINDETKVVNYKIITIDELGILAGKNDREAQDEIVYRYLNQDAINLSQKNIKPINWENIIERAIDDQYFTYFLLFFAFDHDEYHVIFDVLFDVLFENVKLAAKTGDSMAQYNLGQMYYRGISTKKNIQKAIKWITKSADQNNKYGLINLARFYEYGDGVLLDIDKATQLLEQASCQNFSKAQFYLGRIYMYKDPPDYKLAFKYYQQAANQNHSSAQYFIAVFYKTGKCVAQDYKKAVHWLTLAASQGLNSAKIKLAEMYMKGIDVEQNYHKAFELLNSSIYDDGTNNYYDEVAMTELACMYKRGLGIEKNISKAIYLHIKSRNTKNIFKIFEINTITFINPINVDCENNNLSDIDQLESKIIYKLQFLMIKLKYEWSNIYHDDISNSLQEIENSFTRLIKLRIQLNNSSAMINCLSFKKNTSYKFDVFNTKNAYVNYYVYDDISYINIGLNNIKLVNNFQKNLDKFMFCNIFLDLELALENKHKEKIDDLINAVKNDDRSHQLNIVKDLDNIKFVLSQTKKISSKLIGYVNILMNDLKSNTHIRNQQFQLEYANIFGYD